MEPTGYIDSRGIEIRTGDLIELNPKYNLSRPNPYRVIVKMDEEGNINFQTFDLLPDAWTIVGSIHANAYPELKEEIKRL